MLLFGKKMFDWSGIHDIPLAERKKAIVASAMDFLKKMHTEGEKTLAGSRVKLAGADSNLVDSNPITLVVSDTIKGPDRGYEILFDEVNMRQSQNDSFEIIDVTGGVTFYQVVPGEEAKLSKIPASAKTTVSFLRFIGGFPILDDWIRFNKYYKIEQLFADTTRRWWDNKATIFYGLLTALTGIDQAYGGSDVQTINNAIANILTDLQAAGYAIDENQGFVITCHPLLKERILMALAASFVNPNTNLRQIVFNVTRVVTTTKVASTHYWVSMPGMKNQRGEWEDFNMREPQRNELVLGADHIWTGAYNGAISEKKQHKRCLLT